MKRVFLIVLDSFGIGQMPDAAAYGDINVNTLGSVSKSPFFHMENMKNMGLFNIDGVEVGEKTDHPTAAYTRMTERSRGKDTTIGHWEIAGLYTPKPFKTYPDGFPQELMEEFSRQTGRGGSAPAEMCCAISRTPAHRSLRITGTSMCAPAN